MTFRVPRVPPRIVRNYTIRKQLSHQIGVVPFDEMFRALEQEIEWQKQELTDETLT